MESISTKINRFYLFIKDYKEDAPNTRFKSWEWCHEAFLLNKDYYQNASKEEQDKIIDYLALHLGFYLASWGMYRGSSFLLQRDYKTHKKVVKIILNPQYNLLWNYEPSNDNKQKASNLLFGVNGKSGIFKEIINAYNNNGENNAIPSDTLITKILMGTYGCIPSFDRFLKDGIDAYNVSIDRLRDFIKLPNKANKETFLALVNLVLNEPNEFKVDSQFYYPKMKCLDMFFWEIGYELYLITGLAIDKGYDKNKKTLEKAKSLGLCKEDASIEDAINAIREKNK